MKAQARKQCTYSIKDLQVLLPKLLRTHCSVCWLRKMARHSWRWMDVYRRNFRGRVADFMMKKFKSHRGVPAEIDKAKRLRPTSA